MARLIVCVFAILLILVNLKSYDAASRVVRSPQLGIFGVGGVIGGISAYPGAGYGYGGRGIFGHPHHYHRGFGGGYGGYGGGYGGGYSGSYGGGYGGPGFGGPGFGGPGYGGPGYGYGGRNGGLSFSKSESISFGAGGAAQSSASSNAGGFGK